MSDTLAVAVVGAVQVIILALIQRSMTKGRKQDKEERAVVATKVAETKETLDQVHTAVNTNFEKQAARLEAARAEIAQLSAALASRDAS